MMERDVAKAAAARKTTLDRYCETRTIVQVSETTVSIGVKGEGGTTLTV